MGRLDIELEPSELGWEPERDALHAGQEWLPWQADHEEGYEPIIIRGSD